MEDDLTEPRIYWKGAKNMATLTTPDIPARHSFEERMFATALYERLIDPSKASQTAPDTSGLSSGLEWVGYFCGLS